MLLCVSAALLAACGGRSSTLPQTAAATGRAPSATAATADTPSGMPGDTPSGMPGDTPSGMPGVDFACVPVPQNGQASCTIAINVAIPTLADPATPAALIPGLHPADLQNAYALPSGNAGGTVAIVDAYDDAAAESDLAVYRSTFGLPACTHDNGCFRKVDQRGGTLYPLPDAGWAQETSLDLDMVSAACPRCSIVLVEANSASLDDLGAAVDEAASLGASAISNSYYAPEWSGETAEDAHYAHPGVAITVSAGDTPHPAYPATAPGVVAVGGTSLSGGSGAWSESAWQYGARGCSAYEAKPHWQNASPCATRAAVDVAAVADPQTGVALFDTAAGGWMVAGGTSAGAPLIAAAATLAGPFAGPAYPYEHRAAFNDIAPAGVDEVTGLGSPRGVGGL